MRANQPTFNASFTLYKTKFDNRLQSFASIVPGTTTTETFFQNVGRVEAHGAELSGQFKPRLLGGKLCFNANVAYNISKFKDGYSNLPIAGNTVPDFPKWLVQAGVTAERTTWAVLNVSSLLHLVALHQFHQLRDHQRLLGVGRLSRPRQAACTVGPLKEVKLRFNVDNLFDKDYLGTISTTTNTPATFRPGPWRTFQLSLTAAL